MKLKLALIALFSVAYFVLPSSVAQADMQVSCSAKGDCAGHDQDAGCGMPGLCGYCCVGGTCSFDCCGGGTKNCPAQDD